MDMHSPKYRINNDEDLLTHWQRLMGPGGFGERSLWMIFLDDQGDTLPVIFPMDELPVEPDEQLVLNLVSILNEVLATTPATATALLLSRPGADAVRTSDRRWAQALIDAIPPPMRRGPIHLATRDRVRALAPDDLVSAA